MSLPSWMRGQWDVVVFNAGLHDFNRDPGTPLGRYVDNMISIAEMLAQHSPRCFFATTTPGRESVAYNEAVVPRLIERGVGVIDLYGFAAPRMTQLETRPGNVHFNDLGYRLLGEQVAHEISRCLSRVDALYPLAAKLSRQ